MYKEALCPHAVTDWTQTINYLCFHFFKLMSKFWWKCQTWVCRCLERWGGVAGLPHLGEQYSKLFMATLLRAAVTLYNTKINFRKVLNGCCVESLFIELFEKSTSVFKPVFKSLSVGSYLLLHHIDHKARLSPWVIMHFVWVKCTWTRAYFRYGVMFWLGVSIVTS